MQQVAKGPARVLNSIPRGLRREQAAAYWGISASKWDQLVSEGTVPKPRLLGVMKLWDSRELDAAFDELPHDGKSNVLDEWTSS